MVVCVVTILFINSVSGEDFIVTSPTTELTFFRGVSDRHSECITIDIIDDDVYEEEQQFTVCISPVASIPVYITSYNNTYRLEDNSGLFIINNKVIHPLLCTLYL